MQDPIVHKKHKKIVESDDYEEDTNSPKVKYGKKGQELAPCGRPSFAANPVNKKFNSRYRNPENKNKLGGKLLDLGKATGIVAVTLFGFDVSFEASNSGDRLRIFKSAAWYALTDEEVEEVLEHTDDQVDDYLKGLVTAGIRLWRYEATEEARKSFPKRGICAIGREPDIPDASCSVSWTACAIPVS